MLYTECLHAAATLFMVGLIWTMQLVHYPLFAKVRDHVAYQRAHQWRIALLVGPAMLVEMGTALVLLWRFPDSSLLRTGLFLLAIIWLSTAFLQGPAHAKLSRAWNWETHRFLVSSNWVRTLTWTARAWVALKVLVP